MGVDPLLGNGRNTAHAKKVFSVWSAPCPLLGNGKHAIGTIEEAVFSMVPPRGYISSPCGGGIEYLHRDTASRRRRRKGKSQM
jgi:hypothetical protein